MGRTLIAGLVVVWSLFLPPHTRADNPLRIACWNVENLFDTIPNPPCMDADFTPEGSHHWGTRRYWSKLGKISRTIAGIGGVSPCALVGLVEVENDSVLHDLVRRTSLARLGYDYLVTHGPDPRGINVGLLYQPMCFAPIGQNDLRIAPPASRKRHREQPHPTRDILHTWGRIQSGDTLDVFVLHLPSRRGGKLAQTYRQRIAERLMEYADSVHAVRQTPLMLFMGDFNAPSNDALFHGPLATLTQLTHDLSGTYYFQQEWSQIDHVLVNTPLLQHFDCQISNYTAPYLLRTRADVSYPFRTYLGTYYQGGISDHLPVVLDLLPRESTPKSNSHQ